MERRKAIGLLAFGTLGLVACQRQEGLAPASASKDIEKPVPEGWKLFTSERYPYQIYYPPEWESLPSSKFPPFYADRDFFVNNVHPKYTNGNLIEDSYTEGAMIWTSPLPSGQTIEDYINKKWKDITSYQHPVIGHEISEFKTKEINGKILEYAFTGGNTDLLALPFLGVLQFKGPLALEVIFSKDQKIWTVLFGAVAETIETDKFKKMAETFRFTK